MTLSVYLALSTKLKCSNISKYAPKNLAYVNGAIKKSVPLDLKQMHGIIFNKTQNSLALLEGGMRRMNENRSGINEGYLADLELSTLLTAVMENLHAVSHFKHETFTALRYP